MGQQASGEKGKTFLHGVSTEACGTPGGSLVEPLAAATPGDHCRPPCAFCLLFSHMVWFASGAVEPSGDPGCWGSTRWTYQEHVYF